MESALAITGYAGRFPNCSSILDFKKKLFGGVDMVGEPRRYPKVNLRS